VSLIKNITWLTVLQLANILIPLIVLPYIVRVLGTEAFGRVSYAQNVISYLTLLVNFGFDYSATREISINKDIHETRNRIFWTVIKAKSILLLVSFMLLVILYICFDKVADNLSLYVIVFMTNIGIVFFPVWFLQGLSKMRRLAVFNVFFRSSGLILTFFFIHDQADYLLYPLLISLGYVIVGFVSFFYVIKRYNISFVMFKKSFDFSIIKASGFVFLNMLFATLYSSASLTILGFYFDDKDIGLFSGAQKIIYAIMLLTSTPLQLAIFPEISYKFSESLMAGKLFFHKVLKNVIIYGLIISTMTFLLSEKLVLFLLGAEFVSTVPLMKIFSVLPFLVMLASLFTIQGLYGAGLQKYAPLIGALISIFSILANVLFLQKYGMHVAGVVWVISECIEILFAGALFYIGLRKINTKNTLTGCT